MTPETNGPVTILYEDAHLVAVAKPPGIPTVAADRTRDSLSKRLQQERTKVPHGNAERRSDPLGLVHRLDAPVSGVVLWGKTPRATRRLSQQFAERSVRKTYWALVSDPESRLSQTVFPELWHDWITDSTDRTGRVQIVDPDTTGAREARTQLLAARPITVPRGQGDVDSNGNSAIEPLAWLTLRPETGRTHQIRVQASHRSLSILGDHTYGASRPFDAPDSAIALHAFEIACRHPTRGDELVIRCEPPEPLWSSWLPVAAGLGPQRGPRG